MPDQAVNQPSTKFLFLSFWFPEKNVSPEANFTHLQKRNIPQKEVEFRFTRYLKRVLHAGYSLTLARSSIASGHY